MFGTRRAQPVHKTGLLNLPAVKGDDTHKFNHVMHDVRSEFSRNIKSYNMAVTSVMNRNLSQALRDAHATIDTLNRSQQSTYKAMCKIIQIQRQRVKDNYQLYQQNLRDGKKLSPHATLMIKRKAVQGTQLEPLQHSVPESASTEVSVPENPPETGQMLGASTLPPINPTDVEYNSSTTSSTQTIEQKQNHENDSNKFSPSNNNKETDQVETTTDNQPDGGESQMLALKPYLDFPSRASSKKAFFTASLRPTLPPINEFAVDQESSLHPSSHGADGKDLRQPPNHLGSIKASYAGSTKGGSSSMGLTNDSSDEDTIISAQKATSLRTKIADIERRHMKEFLKKQNLERKLKPYEIDSSVSEANEASSDEQPINSQKVNKSIAAERRKLAKLREEHRKAVLNSENCYSYTQLKDGRFLQGAMAYKRRRFLPPSNRAKHEREQILKSEAAKAEMNDEKIGEFFTKIDLPVPSEITKKVLRKRETKTLLNLSDIKPEIVAEPIEVEREKSMVPLTEVAKDITYIRQYVRPADRAELPTKNTSWDPSY